MDTDRSKTSAQLIEDLTEPYRKLAAWRGYETRKAIPKRHQKPTSPIDPPSVCDPWLTIYF